MAKISGLRTNAAVKVASTWGTAAAASTGDKHVGTIDHSVNESMLEAIAIGSGYHLPTEATRGSEKPTVQLEGDAHFDGTFGKVLSQFMGTDTPSAEITASQADYRHVITFNETRNAKYLSVAYESSSSTVHEFPTCAVRSIGISTPQIPGYLKYSAELVANKLELSTAVNTNAVLAAATLRDTDIISPAFDDDHWLDTQASTTLASGDQIDIMSYDLKLSQATESSNEIKGTAGSAAPAVQGGLTGELTIVVNGLVDHALYAYWLAETALKNRLTIEGPQIGTGSLKSLNIYIPRMKLLKTVKYSVTSPGINPVSYTFQILRASSNPTGMNSTYPYFEIINGLSTAFTA